MFKTEEDIKNKSFKRIYLLFGKEAYLKLGCAEALRKAVLDGGDEMNVATFSGKGTSLDDFISACETMPFLSERRVVYLKDSDFFKNKNDSFVSYIEKIPDYTVAIFVETNVDKKTKSYKTVEKIGVAEEFKEPSPETIKNYVISKLNGAGKKIGRAAYNMFISYVGNDLSNILNETDKLIAFVGDRNIINESDVEAITSQELESVTYKILDFLSNGDMNNAFVLYKRLIAINVEPMSIMGLISNQYVLFYRLKELEEQGMSNDIIATELNVHPYRVKLAQAIIGKFSKKRLAEIMNECVVMGEKIRAGEIDDGAAVELIMVECMKH